ncbi:MAG TPA: nitrate/nitrite transporter NrtS [Syntrophales bacterium]|nr:nitrate/nitrite transporter NrtS [Syntrophales bacterium]
MTTFFAAVTERGTVVTSARVALLVGSILALINYGDRIFLHGNMSSPDWVKLALTYCVPYCVATYGAARYAARHTSGKKNNTTTG